MVMGPDTVERKKRKRSGRQHQVVVVNVMHGSFHNNYGFDVASYLLKRRHDGRHRFFMGCFSTSIADGHH
jgi:hypothetical protein